MLVMCAGSQCFPDANAAGQRYRPPCQPDARTTCIRAAWEFHANEPVVESVAEGSSGTAMPDPSSELKPEQVISPHLISRQGVLLVGGVYAVRQRGVADPALAVGGDFSHEASVRLHGPSPMGRLEGEQSACRGSQQPELARRAQPLDVPGQSQFFNMNDLSPLMGIPQHKCQWQTTRTDDVGDPQPPGHRTGSRDQRRCCS